MKVTITKSFGWLLTLATLAASTPAFAGSCMEFANLAVSKTAKMNNGSAPHSLTDLARDYETVQIDGDAKRPDLYVCKRKGSGGSCGGYKLTSFMGSAPNSWVLELPHQIAKFNFVLKDQACELQQIEVDRGLTAQAKDCENPEEAYKKVKSSLNAERWQAFIDRVKAACVIGKDFFAKPKNSKGVPSNYGGGGSGSSGGAHDSPAGEN